MVMVLKTSLGYTQFVVDMFFQPETRKKALTRGCRHQVALGYVDLGVQCSTAWGLKRRGKPDPRIDTFASSAGLPVTAKLGGPEMPGFTCGAPMGLWLFSWKSKPFL